MADTITTTTRRGIIAGMVTVPLAAAALATPAIASTSSLDADIDRVADQWRRCGTGSLKLSEADFDALGDELDAISRRVEALPMTAANARLRAKAVLMIHEGDASTFYEDGEAADVRLVRQMLTSLGGN